MMHVLVILLCINLVRSSTYSGLFHIKSNECRMVRPIEITQPYRLFTSTEDTKLLRRPFHSEEDEKVELLEILGQSVQSVEAAMVKQCRGVVNASYLKEDMNGFVASIETQVAAQDEVQKIVYSGDPKNRIDVVLMGDGYTLEERDQFFTDMQRMTRDMFEGDTFVPYLPLFNIWALFRPSKESGLGVGGRAKNTAFKLYRSGTELRGIYCGNEWAARRACKAIGQYACDFPSLIANDPYYGGLGGEFTIATKSKTTGTLVLRHEMGHNFGRVGEEYDGGQVYNGANSDSSNINVSWKHWLTNQKNSKPEDAVLLLQAYPWYNLAKGAYSMTFTSTGKYQRWLMRLTLSGVQDENSFSISLDGKTLPWKTNGLRDRSFYEWQGNEKDGNAFRAGKHTIVVKGTPANINQIRQFCSFTLHEFKAEDEFQKDDNEVISIYPTWSARGRKTYRPNNEKCLMRNMRSTRFCKVCEENMWLKFFDRIELIDDVVQTKNTDSISVTVQVIPLAQKRPKNGIFKNNLDEVYQVRWYKSNILQESFNDKFNIDIPNSGNRSNWKVVVTFITSMVRYDPQNLLQSSKNFKI